MAIFYTDVALNQQQWLNFPGQPGSQTLTNQPGNQNLAILEGPDQITATYTWVGTEAVGDIINLGILPAGVVVSAPDGSVDSGVTAPAVTLTVAIGDNDLALLSAQPIPNPQVPVDTIIAPNQAPLWVSGTTYAKGNVVYDATSTPANQVYTCMAATSGTTAPHSAATTVWMPNQQRYSATINIAGASGDVEFAGGTQNYGGPLSLLPYSTVPGQAALGATANQIAASQYQTQQDCWAQAVILTISTPVAGAVSVFRVPYIPAN